MDDKSEFNDVIMADDGKGDRVFIPSIFIHYEFGEILKKEVEDNK